MGVALTTACRATADYLPHPESRLIERVKPRVSSTGGRYSGMAWEARPIPGRRPDNVERRASIMTSGSQIHSVSPVCYYIQGLYEWNNIIIVLRCTLIYQSITFLFKMKLYD